MVKLAPSKNPEKDSKKFGIIVLVCGILFLFLWIFGAASLATGVRGLILSRRVKSTKYTVFSVVGILLGLVAIVYYYTVGRG